MFYFILATVMSASFIILNASKAHNFPEPLDAKTERELFLKLEKDKDTSARDKLITHNLRLVAHLVRKYYGSSQNSEDLVSIGTIGLIKAIDSYRLSSGVKFATYAAKCIQNEILMHFRAQRKTQGEVSINETIDIDKDGNPLTYIDIIKIEDTIADDIDTKDKVTKAMYYINNRLSKRERQILTLRYGLNNKKPITQREVSEKLNISRSYVSRIEKAALDKINAYLK